MRPRIFVIVLAAISLLLAVSFASLGFAEGSPYIDDPVGEEHPWGGDNYGDGGTGSGETIPSIDGALYYPQRLAVASLWSRLTKLIDGSVASAKSTNKVTSATTLSNRTTTMDKSTKGVRAK